MRSAPVSGPASAATKCSRTPATAAGLRSCTSSAGPNHSGSPNWTPPPPGRSGSWPRTDACAHGLQRPPLRRARSSTCAAAGSAHSIPASTNARGPRRSRVMSRRPAARPSRRRHDRCPGPAPVRRTARSPHQRRDGRTAQRVAPRQSRRFAHCPHCALRGADEGAASISAPRFRAPGSRRARATRSPPATLMRGSENTVIVASPPKGTSGATTSLPSWAETVASTVALRPSSVAVPRRVRRPSEEATGVTEVRNGAAARRSDSVDDGAAGEAVALLDQAGVVQGEQSVLEQLGRGPQRPDVRRPGQACRAAWPAARGSWPSAPRPSRRGARAARWRGTRRP